MGVWGNIHSWADMLTQKLAKNFFWKTSKNWFINPFIKFSQFSLFFLGAVNRIELGPLSTPRKKFFLVFYLWGVWGNIHSSANMLTQKLATNFFWKTSKNLFVNPKNDFKLKMLSFGLQRVHYPQKWLKISQLSIFTLYYTIKWCFWGSREPI